MPRLALFIDAFGLLCDDLWSYYETAGRPLWAVRGFLLIAPLGWLLIAGINTVS
ncbi:MAG: hypothetical protein HKN59_03335 [Gammaproteobacteria bacterium]|nr:hypothetical protein [Gammaproteobacteria bacterium]